jgi:hypothetical protein
VGEQVKASTNVAVTRLDSADIQLKVDGVVFEVSRLSVTHGINEVPEAVCTLAIGRNVSDANAFAAAHTQTDKLIATRKATITVKLSGDFDIHPKRKAWPEKPFTLFKGRVAGTFRTVAATGQSQLAVQLAGELADMSAGSFMSARVRAGSADDLAFPASMRMFGQGAGGDQNPDVAGQVAFVTNVAGTSLGADLQNDLWVGIKKLIAEIASSTPFAPVGALASLTLNDASPEGGGDAIQALASVEGETPAVKDLAGRDTPYKFGSPVRFRDAFLPMYDTISRSLLLLQTAQVATQTTWDVLIGTILPWFQLQICPGTTFSVVAPICPGLRLPEGQYWKTISPGEYVAIDQKSALDRPLRSVVVHGNIGLDGQAFGGGDANDLPTATGGIYLSTAGQNSTNYGSTLFVKTPPWLASAVTANTLTPKADNIKVAADKGQANGVPHPAAKLGEEYQNVLDHYAHAIYVSLALRGRSLTISGKLRFDIGPGSHVKILGSGDVFRDEEDTLAFDLYAHVIRTTVVIDAETPQAVTSFQLGGVRTETENQDDNFSIAAHPLYTDVMRGMPLVDGLDMNE